MGRPQGKFGHGFQLVGLGSRSHRPHHHRPYQLGATVVMTDVIEDLKGDLDYALYPGWFSGDEVARHAVNLIVNNIRRDPRFASMSILDVEWLIRDARRDLAEDVN